MILKHISVKKLLDLKKQNIFRLAEEQSKSFKKECKNPACVNRRRNGSAYCQECSDINNVKLRNS